ncbi:mitochondrial carrier [Clavulina sp. PMI_390]|nr:mitochondrial carrier [Clavulina sp. PMI_390]
MPQAPSAPLGFTQEEAVDAYNAYMKRHKTVACATFSSLLATLFGYPLDSLKSRLQATRQQISMTGMAAKVWREEGIAGYFRGVVIPLATISAVRAASFTMYTETKSFLHHGNYLTPYKLGDIAIAGWLGGATSGAILSVGSTPFELVKIRRQLEYSIAEQRGERIGKPPSTLQAVKDIVRQSGVRGLYNGFGLHLTRDTLGTGFYFLEYDVARAMLGRQPNGVQGPQPAWMPFKIYDEFLPFACGATAGVTSWAVIYPLDVVKTKVQQRALSGERYRGPWETFMRLVRGTDPARPKPVLLGFARLYRGLGVSAGRSIITHGVLWTLFDYASRYIDNLPSPTIADPNQIRPVS